MARFGHAIGVAQRPRNRRDEDRAAINSEQNASVRDESARTGYHHTGGGSIENVLNLGIRRQKTFQDTEDPVQLGRIGPEKAEPARAQLRACKPSAQPDRWCYRWRFPRPTAEKLCK